MHIDAALVRRLVAARMPEAAGLPIVALHGGWDNRCFRIGDTLVARLPAADRYVPALEKEGTVLPILAPRLPLAIPHVVAEFAAGPGFPRPWSVLAWIDGETAGQVGGAGLATLAGDLAAFLRALHIADPTGGPAAGRHSFGRGGPLCALDAEMRWALPRLGDRAAAVQTLWVRALTSEWREPVVWLHGDLHPGNLLVRDGRLSAVIDWGLAAVGDPAADLAVAWRWFDGAARAAFRAALPMDDDAWLRGAGWAAWKAAITLAGLPGTKADERGWAAGVLDAITEDAELG
jgi:aminoglycoside phosphotransferase (APT) family kinase protein